MSLSLGQQRDQSSHSPRKSTLNIGRTDAEADAPIVRPHDAKSRIIEKVPDAGKDLRQWRSGQQWIRWLYNITNSDLSFSKLREIVKDREARCAVVHGVAKSSTWLSD